MDSLEEIVVMNEVGTVTNKKIRIVKNNKFEDVFFEDIRSIGYKHEKFKGKLIISIVFTIYFLVSIIAASSIFESDEMVLIGSASLMCFFAVLLYYKGYYFLKISKKDGGELRIRISMSNRDEGMELFKALKDGFKRNLIIAKNHKPYKRNITLESQCFN